MPRLGDVDDQRAPAGLLRHVVERIPVATERDNGGTMLGYLEGGRPADAVTGPGDDDSGACQIHPLIVPSGWRMATVRIGATTALRPETSANRHRPFTSTLLLVIHTDKLPGA
jgi:hypothetical protein